MKNEKLHYTVPPASSTSVRCIFIELLLVFLVSITSFNMPNSTSRKRKLCTPVPAPAPPTGLKEYSVSVDQTHSTPEQDLPAPPGFSRKFGSSQKLVKLETLNVDVTTYPSSYKVKDEFNKTAQEIFCKHGDIVADCLFEGSLRMAMFQSACVMYEKLKQFEFSTITLPELESMQTDARDLVKAQLKVGWLEEQLDEIYEAKHCVERHPLMEEELEMNKLCIEALEKELALYRRESSTLYTTIETEKAHAATIIQTYLKAMGKALHFSWRSSKDSSFPTRNIHATADYKLKEELEMAAQVILSHQGDIMSGCLFEGSVRWRLLEIACAVYQKMETLCLKDITLAELEAVRKDVRDLLKAQVDVSWVIKGLDDMYKTRKSVESPSFIQTLLHIMELEKEIKLAEERAREATEKLQAEKVRTATLERKFLDAKERASRFITKSLADGI